MTDSALTCQKEQRRKELRRSEDLSGLDYLEVNDDPHILSVYFLGRAPEKSGEEEILGKDNVRIEGGRRVRDIRVVDLQVHRRDAPDLDDWMEVVVDRPGDFSDYTLRVVEVEDGRPTEKPPSVFDPRYAQLEFSFKDGCSSDLDCKSQEVCPPPQRVEPEINYLAKDYASFRQLILDRLALIMPDWQERHAPDMYVALVEELAYVGDHLSYYQDAVATEAYLETARQRISVRRHARLVDYQMHEGCNARAWICIKTQTDEVLDPDDVAFVTDAGSRADGAALGGSRTGLDGRGEVFEPLVEERVLLRDGDVLDPVGLCGKLREHDTGNSLSRYLWEQFPEETRQLLTENASSGAYSGPVQMALAEELNRLIQIDNLFSAQRSPENAVRAEALALVRQPPQGQVLMRLNRFILEEEYPGKIARSKGIYLYKAHNEIHFYTWGDQICCLPRGATAATLMDQWVIVGRGDEALAEQVSQHQQPKQEPSPDGLRRRTLRLQEGDVLIFEEVIGPRTGSTADADPAHRHAVRLTRVELGEDPLCKQRIPDTPEELPTPIVEIEWGPDDALPFPLCLSATGPACELIENVSVARGNVLLVDHGETLDPPEDLGIVPEAGEVATRCGDECHPAEIVTRPHRFRPRLEKGPLTFSQPLPASGPASGLLAQDPHQATPQIQIKELVDAHAAAGDGLDVSWTAQRDLLSSYGWDRHFVVEIDNEGRACLRFGDGELGRMPEAGAEFRATYRVGNGPSGNVGAGRISQIVFRRNPVGGLEPRNPLPAQGGMPPESLREAKLFAPNSFRTDLQRAVTADDYARLAERHPSVQRAAATLRWTGSWYEVSVAIDPLGEAVELPEGLAATAIAFVSAVRQTVERYLDLEEFGVDLNGQIVGRVVDVLQELRAFVKHDGAPEHLLALVRQKLPRLRTDYVVAVEGGRDQLGLWLGGLVADLERAASMPPRLLYEIKDYLYPYRRIGHDLAVVWAQYVPLDIEMEVCVRGDFLHGHVKVALLEIFSDRVLSDGRRGFFHPDNLTFGDGIFLSQLVAAAQAVPGVESVVVNKLKRLFEEPNQEIENGILPLGPLEVARLDNDPDFPENGQLRLEMKGGR